MRKLSLFSVNYPVTILMVVLAVVLLGYISFDRLGMDLFPTCGRRGFSWRSRRENGPPRKWKNSLSKI